ncbi:tautomerase family protein [Sphingobium sp. H39-3-25]|uniref:tautomerase family protein n=1 Tax=Sphingobium arseniciresistens TaxID=3030834 RepID=UPI0023B95EF4|nr:tautomerase family protein [Sphingobium arseniciresistens]
MPHVIVKLWPGKSDAQKQELSNAILGAVTDILDYADDSVSVGFEEVVPDQWQARVYDPDIRGRWNTLTKQPGYGPGPER